jgi:hypothetical protein
VKALGHSLCDSLQSHELYLLTEMLMRGTEDVEVIAEQGYEAVIIDGGNCWLNKSRTAWIIPKHPMSVSELTTLENLRKL